MDDLEYFFYVNAIIGIIHPKSLVYDDEIVAMFKRIDLLNDGLIDTDEFTRAITQHSVITDSKYQSPIKSS
jgi:Ca2+-binding EF-hand superfamily protein